MAIGRITLSAEVQGLRELRDALGTVLSNERKAAVIGKAMTKALVPVVAALQRTTPLGPTGNLRRAIASKVVEYPLDGNAVGVVGFQRAGRARSEAAAGGTVRVGPDRAYHQWWLEEGTRERFVGTPANQSYVRKAHKRVMRSGRVADIREHQVARQGGYIASSFNRLGPFEFERTPRVPQGGFGQRVQTRPGYPRAFFRKSANPIRIPPMPVGGNNGIPPLQAAFDATQTTVADILSQQLIVALEDIWSGLNATTSPFGVIE